MNVKLRHRAVVAAGTVIVGLGVLAWDYNFWLNHLGFNRERNREQMVSAYAQLRLGMTAHEVAEPVSRLASAGFAVYGTCGGTETCVLEAPSEFGARNWMLYLQFKNELLSSARIRTADSVYEHPAQAPPDLGLGQGVPKEAAAQQ